MKSLAYNFKKDVRCIVPLYFSFPALLASLTSEVGKRLYIMNFPRSFRPEAAHYSLMEQLKDGYLSSYMYGEMRDAFFRRPVVAVFSNELPDTWMLSHDRWKIFQIVWEQGQDGGSGVNRLVPWLVPDSPHVLQMQGLPYGPANMNSGGSTPEADRATIAALKKRK